MAQKSRALWVIVLVVACATLFATAFYTYRETASQELLLQRAWADEVLDRYGADIRVASIGLPEAMVLLHRTNPNPYVFIINGIDNRIHATTSGGFEGWLESLEAADLDVIFYGSTRGRYVPLLEEWLQSHFQQASVGEWTIYVRPERSG
jgi:hypothetical protein